MTVPKLPLLSAAQLARALQKAGFELRRQSGSHLFFSHLDGRSTVVPNHSGEKIDRGLLNKVIRKDLRMERDEFLKLLD